MPNKHRICIEVFHRDGISLGAENERKYGMAIYHWAILIRAKDFDRVGDSIAFDVTDGPLVDPVDLTNLNPGNDWRFRKRAPVDPLATGHFLGALVIGKVPKATTLADLESLLAQIPLPLNQQPEQNCLSWTRNAIQALQTAGLVDGGSVDEIMGAAVQIGKTTMSIGAPRNLKDFFRTAGGKGV